MDLEVELPIFPRAHSHVFLGRGHRENERRTWVVIGICSAMMAIEIVGGSLFGSLALIADGLHMSTHAGALLLAALAYAYARRHADDPSFAFGTGKVGDLAGYTSAIILASIALLIITAAAQRLLHPVGIDFEEAIPIAIVGLVVNVVSAWLLSGGVDGHHHGHARGHRGSHGQGETEESPVVQTAHGRLALEIFENGTPPRFRVRWLGDGGLAAPDVKVETIRAEGTRAVFAFAAKEGFLESEAEIPEPHTFTARLTVAFGSTSETHDIAFAEPAPAAATAKIERDNNMRAAIVHVMADAAVSVLVILGLTLAALFGWLWMDPIAGIIGALVITSWSIGLLRDTGAVLLDRLPDRRLADRLRATIEADGDRLADLHLWRLGPGHLGCAASIVTAKGRSAEYYHRELKRFRGISHLTIEVGAR
jgi:cation diffusion facilitator family transporter